MYANDIIVTGNDQYEIRKFKMFYGKEFEIKDLRHPRYFLDIEFKKGTFLSQHKNVLVLFQDSGMLSWRPCEMPINPYHHLQVDEGDMLLIQVNMRVL